MNNYYSQAGFIRQPMRIGFIDTAPIEYKPEPPKQFVSRMVKNYRDAGYPLGKTRRGLKKWTTKRLLKALGCKSYKEAMRKRKNRTL